MSIGHSSKENRANSRGLEVEHQGESVLERWSRRKAEARRGKLDCDQPVDKPSLALTTVSRDQELLPDNEAQSSLPDPETLDITADFTAFLRDGVDPLLRRAALRRLWSLDPIFAFQDGLVEYGEDFTDSAKLRPFARACDLLSSTAVGFHPNVVDDISFRVADVPDAQLAEVTSSQGDGPEERASPGQCDVQANSQIK